MRPAPGFPKWAPNLGEAVLELGAGRVAGGQASLLTLTWGPREGRGGSAGAPAGVFPAFPVKRQYRRFRTEAHQGSERGSAPALLLLRRPPAGASA